MRLAVLLLVLALGLYAQLLIVSPAELTGNSNTQAVSTSGVARWVLFVAPAGNTGVVRVGDLNTGASRGVPIAPGAGYMMPFAQGAPGYDLTKVFWYAVSPDKVNISWAK